MKITIHGKEPECSAWAISLMKLIENRGGTVEFLNVDESLSLDDTIRFTDGIGHCVISVQEERTGKCKCQGFYQPADCPVHGSR